VREIPLRDRPREKLDRLGADGLGDNELVALLLGSGSQRVDALALANRVLDFAGGLWGLARTSPRGLVSVPGIGPVRSAQLVAAIELGRRALALSAAERPHLGTPPSLAAYLLPLYGTRPVEHFGIVMLDTKHRLIRTTVVSVGSIDSTVVHPREVFREASIAGAAAIVLFHNHPSGDPAPSRDDLVLTARLMEAGDVMGIAVVDHLIVAEGRYFSLAEAGALAFRGLPPWQGKMERS
jgi:DNA repair protein RadC